MIMDQEMTSSFFQRPAIVARRKPDLLPVMEFLKITDVERDSSSVCLGKLVIRTELEWVIGMTY